MAVLSRVIAVINLVIGLPITFILCPWFLLGALVSLGSIPPLELTLSTVLVLAGVWGFFGGMHLLRNRTRFRGFLIVSGVSWLAMALLMLKLNYLVGGVGYAVVLANANLIFVALDLRTRQG